VGASKYQSELHPVFEGNESDQDSYNRSRVSFLDSAQHHTPPPPLPYPSFPIPLHTSTHVILTQSVKRLKNLNRGYSTPDSSPAPPRRGRPKYALFPFVPNFLLVMASLCL
jgi:hypothetical protein